MSHEYAVEENKLLAVAKGLGSRDEMNLAEFPLTVLSTRCNPNQKTLEFKDSVKGRNGEVVERKWIITGADKFGLPTASDDEVLLGLLKLSVDDGFRDRKVFFTRYELLRILKWTTEGRSYSRLQKALDRLSGVRIKASNAFYDNETKSHSTRNFGIIDAYEINDGRSTEPKPSFFTWSDVLFKSFQVGFIKKLDLDYYLTLQSAVSKRLYRYLDKHFWYKAKVQINLFTLAHEKIGISRNYAYASSLRQQLDPALEELVSNGFLAGAEYLGRGQDTEIVMYASLGKPRVQSPTTKDLGKANPDLKEALDEPEPLLVALEQQLVERGIRSNQARKLLSGRDLETLKKISEIIRYCDQVKTSRHGKRMTSPVGFLYRAVEKPEEFVIPKNAETKKTESRQAYLPFGVKRTSVPQGDDELDLRSRYLVARRTQIQECREGVEPSMLVKIRKEVSEALIKLRGVISADRFSEAIEHGIEEKLLKLFGFPDFEIWMAEQTRKRVAARK